MRTTVFVFGSNLKGVHGAGAALTAARQYGAKYGIGVGRTGNAYAIPTKRTPTRDQRQFTLIEIDKYVQDFVKYAANHPEIDFKVTRIGCGLAGYTDEEISPMFKNVGKNVELPANWEVKMRVYLDDERSTPPGWVRTYSAQETIELLKTKRVAELSLDHDLGDNVPTGYEVILWLEKVVLTEGFIPPSLITVHSANPVGKQKMEAGLRSIRKFLNKDV